MPEVLSTLAQSLATLSHDESALRCVQNFTASLGNTRTRLAAFNVTNGLVRRPIEAEETVALGFDQDEDQFALLQGDLVTTESAYFMGERVANSPKYIVLNSSCDLIPNRRNFAALLRIQAVSSDQKDAKAALNLLLQFKRTDSIYLPALPFDAPNVLCNAVQFDGICQIRSEHLILADRIASLTLVGWRIFASFSRMVIARANPREQQMREAIENNLNSSE